MEKLKIDYPILVEGKYDKIKLDSVVDALVVTSDGFRIFKSDEKRALLRKLAERSKIIVLADSDSAGMLIRSCVKGIIPNDRIINVYTPQVKGKEKRKDKPSKEGFVGVEGIAADTVRRLLEPYAGTERKVCGRKITKTDFYELGLSGTDGASERRERICTALELPSTLTANALLEAVNLLCGYDELAALCDRI
ncbi:MAG: DUF4093 domain-containing protein [Clostridia bacterium]|nr:DUF4093 domain-containing protein [Clostridia bacterium]